MSFLFASSHLPQTRVQRPEEEEDENMRPEPHSGMVRSFSHLPQAATAAQQGARRLQSTAPPRAANEAPRPRPPESNIPPRPRYAENIAKQNAAAPQAPPNDPQSHKAFNQWLDRWNEKNVEAAEKQRPDGHVELEKDLPSVRHMLKGKPSGLIDELGTGISEGVTRIGQLAAGAGSLLPGGVGEGFEARRKLYAERAEIMKKYRERDKSIQDSFPLMTPGGALAKGIAAVPEIYNPVNKAGWGAKALNSSWHAVRGYLPNKSLQDAAVAAGGSVVGENAEDLVRKGKMVAGNIAGTATEETLKAVLPDDKARKAPAPNPAPATSKKVGKKLSDYPPLLRANQPRPTSVAKRLDMP